MNWCVWRPLFISRLVSSNHSNSTRLSIQFTGTVEMELHAASSVGCEIHSDAFLQEECIVDKAYSVSYS